VDLNADSIVFNIIEVTANGHLHSPSMESNNH